MISTITIVRKPRPSFHQPTSRASARLITFIMFLPNLTIVLSRRFNPLPLRRPTPGRSHESGVPSIRSNPSSPRPSIRFSDVTTASPPADTQRKPRSSRFFNPIKFAFPTRRPSPIPPSHTAETTIVYPPSQPPDVTSRAPSNSTIIPVPLLPSRPLHGVSVPLCLEMNYR